MENNSYSSYIIPAVIGIAIFSTLKKGGEVIDKLTNPFGSTDPKTESEKTKNSTDFKNLYTKKAESNPFNSNFFTSNLVTIRKMCKDRKTATYYVMPSTVAKNYATHYHNLTTGTFSKFTTTQDNIMDVFSRCKTKVDVWYVGNQYSALFGGDLYNSVNLALNETNKARLNAFIESLPLVLFAKVGTYNLFK